MTDGGWFVSNLQEEFNQTSRPHSGGARPYALLFVMLVLVAIVAYLPATRVGFVWDDDSYVTHERHERTLSDLWRIWVEPRSVRQYYPLVHTGFWIEYHLWRFDPRGYHMVNIALHGLMAGMVWRVLRRLNVPGAWVGAAVFALHPIHVESIAWVTERKNVLSGVFYVASLLACLRFYRINSDTVSRSAVPDDARQSWGWYAAALLLFVCALLSKTVVAVLPVAVLLILWWKHGRWSLRNVVPLIPFFASGIVMGLMTKFLETARSERSVRTGSSRFSSAV